MKRSSGNIETLVEKARAERKPRFRCTYCGKGFVRDVRATHRCRTMRRDSARSDPGVILGFRAWLEFHRRRMGNDRKTWDDFIRNRHHDAFVRFGRYCREIKCIDAEKYFEFLLREKVRLDDWTGDRTYAGFLSEHLFRETATEAVGRGVDTIREWAWNDPSGTPARYFTDGGPGRIAQDIESGRISGWVLYNCSAGAAFLERLDQERTDLIWPRIVPELWKNKFVLHPDDVRWTRSRLRKEGL